MFGIRETIKPLTREEEKYLSYRYKYEGDKAAGAKLVESQIPFVMKMVMSYPSKTKEDQFDMFQEGMIGLMKAVDKFDANLGNRLVSYAVWWIREYIQIYIKNNWSVVKRVTTQEGRKLFPYAVKGYISEEDANRLGITKEQVAEYANHLIRDCSLYNTVNGTDLTFDEILEDNEDHRQEPLLLEAEKRTLIGSVVSDALKELDKRERRIIRDRYLSDNPSTLQEIGDKLGVTRERVRQLEKRARHKLETFFDERGIQWMLD